MLNPKQVANFTKECAAWLEAFLKMHGSCAISDVYTAGKRDGFSRAQIKAARAWHGKWITTTDVGTWGWDTDA